MRGHAARAGFARIHFGADQGSPAAALARDRLSAGIGCGADGFASHARGAACAGYSAPRAWHRSLGRRCARTWCAGPLSGVSGAMKRLLLLRHAKAVQANKDTPADAERPLAERGRADAPRMGREMREKGYLPDLILCSPSKRTRETLELANTELRSKAKTEFEDGLYAASARRIVTLLRNLSDKTERALVVGHNPSLEDLALLLAARN